MKTLLCMIRHFGLSCVAAVVLLTALSGSTNAQNGEWTPIWDNNFKYVKEIIFHNNQDGWLMDYNNLFRTSDGGVNWQRVNDLTEPQEAGMLAMTFINAQNGWVFLTTNGFDTRVFKTVNGGQIWSEVALLPDLYISKIMFLNTLTGWAAGSNGTVVKTTDGGETWTTLNTGLNDPNALLSDIHFFDENFGMAVGYNGTVLRTTNGGTSWVIGQQFPDSIFDSVRILSANRVLMTGESGLWVSNDGGSTFINVHQAEHSSLRFLDGSNGYVLRKGNPLDLSFQLYRTNDSGANWVAQSDSPDDARYAGFAQYFVLNANTMWKTQENFDSSLFRTSNGGNSWQRLSHDRNLGFMARGNSVWVRTNRQLDRDMLRSLDNGNTWSYAIVPEASGSFYFRDGLNGWFFAQQQVYRTQDGGSTWAVTANMQLVREIFFADANNGWAVFQGNNTVIFSTSDGGQSWQQQFDADCEVGQMEMVNAQNGWAVCRQGGSVLRYQNGNWQKIATGTNHAFRGMMTGGENLMWAVGSNGLLLRTTNGGNSWTTLQTGMQQQFVSWGATTTGVLYIRQTAQTHVSYDLGQTWQVEPLPFPRTYVQDFTSTIWHRFSPFESGYISSFHGALLRYNPPQTPGVVGLNSPANGAAGVELSPFLGWDMNSHALWYHLQVSQSPDFTSMVIEDYRVPSGTYVTTQILQPGMQYYWRVRGANESSYADWSPVYSFTTANPGWIPQQVPVDGTLNALEFSGSKHGWAVGPNGTIIATQDDGASWAQQTSWTNSQLFDLSFVNQTTGWVSGANGIILHTTNGGQTWSPQNSGVTLNLFGIYFTDTNNGWAAGSAGTILRTANGGNTWVEQTTPTSNFLTDIRFTSPTNGVAIGTSGTILQTANGGNTWTVRNSGTTLGLSRVYFQNPQTGWIVGSSGILLKTEDGGASWSPVNSGTTAVLHNIRFATDLKGWIVGQGGLILETNDGGESWEQVESNTGNNLGGLSVAGPAVFASGQFGVLLRHLWEPDPFVPAPAAGITLTVSDENNWSRNLVFGFHPDATEGYDSGLDQLAPPPPPFGVFEAQFQRFINGEYLLLYTDFRPYTDGTTKWIPHLQWSSGSETYLLQWNPAELEAEGNYSINYCLDNNTPWPVCDEVDMRLQNSLVIPINYWTLAIVHAPDDPDDVIVLHNAKWNLISMPQDVAPVAPGSIFQTYENGTLFGFNGIYYSETEIAPKRGYWIYLNQAEQVTYDQNLLESFTISLTTGWNLIGTPSSPLNFADIEDPNGILNLGSAYGYFDPNVGYQPAQVLHPGRGYWVNTKQPGAITLTGGGAASPRPMALNGFHNLGIGNNGALPRHLMLGSPDTGLPEDLFTELPPLPPAGAFDARFSDHTWLTLQLDAEVMLQAAGEEISFTYTAPEGEEMSLMQLSLVRSGQPAGLIYLEHGETVTVDGSGLQQLSVVINPTVSIPGEPADLPLTTALLQNYPNPFNPTTTIGYALAETGTVRLDVYNIQGQRVATLVNGTQTAGHHSISFDASRLASGTYIYRLQTGSSSITKMMMLVK